MVDALHDQVEELPREQRLRDRLAVRLAAEIVSGRLRPADAFPSADDIVRHYGVSRTVAREALQTLTMIGLVHAQQGKRAEVLPPDGWNVLSAVVQEALVREGKAGPMLADLYDFRLLIEPPAAAWVAERGSDEEVTELRRLAAAMREAAEAGEGAGRVLGIDREFHNLVARATGNPVLAGVRRDVADVLGTLFAVSRLGAAQLAEVAAQHERIAAAIAARDPVAARAAMTEHLVWARRAELGEDGAS